MKKKNIVIGVLLFLVVALAIFSGYSFQKSQSLSKRLTVANGIYPKIYDVLDSITVTNFENQINDGKNLVVYVGRPTCGDCNDFEPHLIKMIKSKNLSSTVKYVNVAQLKKDRDEWQRFTKKYRIKYTPTLAEFKNGKLVDKVNWSPENGTNLKEFNQFLDQLK